MVKHPGSGNCRSLYHPWAWRGKWERTPLFLEPSEICIQRRGHPTECVLCGGEHSLQGQRTLNPSLFPSFDTPIALPFGQSHLKVNSTALRCQLLRQVVELRSVARSGWGGKDVSGTVKNTQHSELTCAFPKVELLLKFNGWALKSYWKTQNVI